MKTPEEAKNAHDYKCECVYIDNSFPMKDNSNWGSQQWKDGDGTPETLKKALKLDQKLNATVMMTKKKTKAQTW